MRNTIYDVLKNGKIDIKKEYSRIYDLFYEVPFEQDYGQVVTIQDVVNEYFGMLNFSLIGRCLSLEDFDESYGYHFVPQPQDFSLETLISISEYTINFIQALMMVGRFEVKTLHKMMMHIQSCMEDVGFKQLNKEGIIIFVENNPAAISVAEIADQDLSYSILEYNHYRLRGDLERKKAILKNMADDIEPERKLLNGINKNFASDLFQLMNKFIRHNNSENEYIANLPDSNIETIYDDIYQMWLLAKLQLEYVKKSQNISNLIKEIND